MSKRKKIDICKAITKIIRKRIAEDGNPEFLVSFHDTFEPIENLSRECYDLMHPDDRGMLPIPNEDDVEPELASVPNIDSEIGLWKVEAIPVVRKSRRGYECVIKWTDAWVRRSIIQPDMIKAFELRESQEATRLDETNAVAAGPVSADTHSTNMADENSGNDSVLTIAEISQKTSPNFFELYSFASDQPIDSGKNSICVRCKINGTDNECAVKILRSTPEVNVEIYALSVCSGHPNVVKLLNVIKDDHFVFIVTELLVGEDLHTYVKRNRSLDENSSRKIFNQIAHALSHIHSKKIVHRNLEMRNIMLSGDGNVKIFGFSSAAEMILSHQKTPRRLNLSLFNAPPEALTKKIFKKEADVWCLGVILFKMLFGYHPYDTTSNCAEVQQRAMSCNIQFDYSRIPPLSPSVMHLIECLLVPDHKKRIQLNEVVKHSWCCPSENSAFIGFISEEGTFQQIEELSSTQRAELIQKLQSIDEKNGPSTQSTDKLGDSPQAVCAENVTILSISDTGVPDLKCHICSKKFKTKRILNAHEKIHLNLTYKCEEEECKRQFSTRGKLSRHIKFTHNRKISRSEKEGKKGADAKEKTISCEICHTKFSQKWILKRHIKSMHSLTAFECYLCHLKAFKRVDCLRHHLQSKHPNN